MSTAPKRTPPNWGHCGHGADPTTDPVGCRGIRVAGHTTCLAHLPDPDRATYLAGLTPGIDIDHRGTPFDEPLLEGLLGALRNPNTQRIELGRAWFDSASFSADAGFSGARFSADAGFSGARFSGDAGFSGASFSGDALFNHATFTADAGFSGASFTADARFNGATFTATVQFGKARFSANAGFGGARFSGDTWFNGATFSGDALFFDATFFANAGFGEATFSGETWFIGAAFSGGARFGGATFTADARFFDATFSDLADFRRATFSGDADFSRTRFTTAQLFGPLVCQGSVDVSLADFKAPTTLEIAAREVRCVRTRWESTATLQLRYATVDLTDAVLSSPVAIIARPTLFKSDKVVDESLLTSLNLKPDVRVISVRGVDAAHLVLTDTDLTECRFTGAFHLDQLRLEGRCTFAPTPTNFHRWSRRRALAEEHHWRAQRAGTENPKPPRGWHKRPKQDDPNPAPGPGSLAATYRQLRKGFEDSKNEPGAADFYYGEMEMRRHDQTGTPRVERDLLWMYWLLSGYGLRASRSLLWLVGAMAISVLALVLWGLPTYAPLPTASGSLNGNSITLTANKPDLTIDGQLMTLPRAAGAVRVVMNSVVFRTSGQNLTTAGTYIELATRIFEPILLLLALLAVRNRVKR